MYNSDQHLTLSTIQQYLDHAVSSEEVREIEEHVHSCSQCSDMLALTQQLFEVSDRTTEIQPPASLLKMAAKAAVEKLARGTNELRKFLPQIADSRLSPASAGMRGATQSRHVLYSDGDSLVNLEIERSASDPELYTIRGQISIQTRDDLTGIEVQLLHEQDVVRRGITDKVGQFRISGLKHDSYQLLFGQQKHDILIENIEF